MPLGGDDGPNDDAESAVPVRRGVGIDPFLCPIVGELNPFMLIDELEDGISNASCSAFVAFRMCTVFATSVIVDDTWLAAASSKLTGDIPALVAWVFVAVTRLLSVASARSRRTRNASVSTSDRSRRGLRSKVRMSSTM